MPQAFDRARTRSPDSSKSPTVTAIRATRARLTPITLRRLREQVRARASRTNDQARRRPDARRWRIPRRSSKRLSGSKRARGRAELRLAATQSKGDVREFLHGNDRILTLARSVLIVNRAGCGHLFDIDEHRRRFVATAARSPSATPYDLAIAVAGGG
jgi:hypothetical protein